MLSNSASLSKFSKRFPPFKWYIFNKILNNFDTYPVKKNYVISFFFPTKFLTYAQIWLLCIILCYVQCKNVKLIFGSKSNVICSGENFSNRFIQRLNILHYIYFRTYGINSIIRQCFLPDIYSKSWGFVKFTCYIRKRTKRLKVIKWNRQKTSYMKFVTNTLHKIAYKSGFSFKEVINNLLQSEL